MNAARPLWPGLRNSIVVIVGVGRDSIGKGGKTRRRAEGGSKNRRAITTESQTNDVVPDDPCSFGSVSRQCQAQRV